MTLKVPMLLGAILLCVAAVCSAAEEKEVIRLWPKGLPEGSKRYEADKVEAMKAKTTAERIAFVDDPTMTLYPAPGDKANGCTVLICPGGGYSILAWPKEGLEIAEWFNSFGVTAAVLKYRVPRRHPEQPHAEPLQDAQRAIRILRKNAKGWGVDPRRLGVLGFSAGGHLTVMTALQYSQNTYNKVDEADALSCRPDFVIPIYAAYLGDKEDPSKLGSWVKITKETPPMFLAVTWDDKWRGVHSALLFAELKKVGVQAEVHVYSKGGHGYGIRPSDNPVSTWHKRCEQWMQVSGLLKPASGS